MNHDRRNPAIFTEMSNVLHLSEEHKGKPGFARDQKMKEMVEEMAEGEWK